MIDGLVLAIQFLTRIPINKRINFNEKNIKRSLLFFAPIGLLIGLLSAIPFIFLYKYSVQVGAAITLFLMVILTGGLHLDGLSDTCDGFFSGRENSRIEEIMKDSRIGAFGVIAIVLVLLLKFAILTSLSQGMWIAIPLSLANARLVTSYLISEKKTNKNSSLGKMFNNSNPKNYIVVAIPLYMMLVIGINLLFVIPLIACFILGEAITRLTYKKIGGFSGDVYGATIEISELLSLLLCWGVMIWN
ncbi:MAG: adenosylcobinamide-GDP ribazoletransferase [Gudongella sp.]|nr:adenosylcobinamide-GDP ribazoletransferase [Gudongella sp.]